MHRVRLGTGCLQVAAPPEFGHRSVVGVVRTLRQPASTAVSIPASLRRSGTRERARRKRARQRRSAGRGSGRGGPKRGGRTSAAPPAAAVSRERKEKGIMRGHFSEKSSMFSIITERSNVAGSYGLRV